MTQTSGDATHASAATPADHLRRVRICHRIVMTCALAPMALGFVIVLAYLLFDWDWLVDAGMLLFPLGGLAVLTGLVVCVSEFLQRRQYARVSHASAGFRWMYLGLFLLLANFPIALFGVPWFVSLSSRVPMVHVVVVNHSGTTLDHCDVVSTWASRPHDTLPNAGAVDDYLKLRRAGGLRIHLAKGGDVRDIPLPIPSSFDGIGGQFNVDIQPGPRADVKSRAGGVSD